MKIIAIGDIHGRTDWKDILADNSWDKVVFIGDYFDSHEEISATKQLKNFREILRLKRTQPERVVLLLGNHDFHYLDGAGEQYSGYQYNASEKINHVLQAATKKKMIQIAFLQDQYLFSHAGVTETWMRAQGYTKDQAPDVFINQQFRENPACLGFTLGENASVIGDDVTQTPIWVRPESLLLDALPGYLQVVGHTEQEKLSLTNGKVYFIDTLRTSGEWWEAETGLLKRQNKEKSKLII